MKKILLALGLVAVTFVACKEPTTEEKAKDAAKSAQADGAKKMDDMKKEAGKVEMPKVEIK